MIKSILIVVLISILLFTMLSIRKLNWLYRNKMLKLLFIRHKGEEFVPWRDVLSPKCSKIVDTNYLEKFFSNRNKHLLDLSKKKSIIVIDFTSPESTWNHFCGTSGFLFFDSRKKEQLEYFPICIN